MISAPNTADGYPIIEMRWGSLWEQAWGGLGGGTFLFGAGGREVFVLHFNRGPVALHPAEEGTPGPGAESGRAGGDVRLHRQARWNAQATPRYQMDTS